MPTRLCSLPPRRNRAYPWACPLIDLSGVPPNSQTLNLTSLLFMNGFEQEESRLWILAPGSDSPNVEGTRTNRTTLGMARAIPSPLITILSLHLDFREFLGFFLSRFAGTREVTRLERICLFLRAGCVHSGSRFLQIYRTRHGQ